MRFEMASERLEELKFFYNMCLKEHARALLNLEEYLKKIAIIWKAIEDTEIVDLKLYGSATTEYSQMGEVLRKFNIEVELSSTILPYRLNGLVDHFHDEALNSNLSVTNSFKSPAPEKLADIDDLNDLDINHSVIAKHVQDYEGDCIITCVKEAKSKLVYIMDMSPPYEPIDLSKYLRGTPKRLSRVPNFGVIFGYACDNYMFRAVRSDIEIQAGAEVSLYLIDVGELTYVPVESDMIYDLPAKYQQAPPQAILCHLLKVTGYAETDIENFVEQNKYVKQKFRILSCSNNVPDIEMMIQTIESKENLLVNPFQKSRWELSNDIAGPSNSNHIVSYNGSDTLLNNDPKALNIESFSKISAHHSGVTEEQRKILYEEPLGTDNAMEAVMGYNPQDDKRICPFYDKKINGCFKGAKCRLEHVEKLKDGWTRDRDTHKLNNRGDVAYPKAGSTIRIVTTHVVNFDTFYAQILNQDKNIPSLREIIIDMNKTETVGRYRTLTKLPSEQELVIAKYTDGRWYRCRVLSVIDADNIKVFYVDYGNCTSVTLQNIRKWDEQYDYYPFQAYSCKLDNIEKATGFNAEATDLVRKIMLDRTLTATVTHNLSQLGLTVLDTNGDDVGESLCKLNYAKAKEATRISTKQRFVPA